MKRKILSFASVGVFLAVVLSSMQTGTHGNLGNRTGSNGGSDGCNSCHGNSNPATSVMITLLDNGTPVTTYTPGQTYTLRMSGANTTNGRPKFGFQLTAANEAGTSVGSIATNGVNNVATRAGNTLIEHTQPLDGTLENDNYNYVRDFTWTAPAAGTGNVKFYAVLNAVNGNGNDDSNGNDQWNKGQSGIITEAGGSSIRPVNELKEVKIFPNPGNDILNIQVGSGGSTEVIVHDINGRTVKPTQHFFAGKEQNYRMDISALPQGTYFVNIKQGHLGSVIKFQKL